MKNFSFGRINIRSNIEAKIAKNWTMAVDLAGRVQRSNRPGFSGDPAEWNNIAQQAMRAHPYVPENYNGLPVSTNTSSATVSPLASSRVRVMQKAIRSIFSQIFQQSMIFLS